LRSHPGVHPSVCWFVRATSISSDIGCVVPPHRVIWADAITCSIGAPDQFPAPVEIAATWHARGIGPWHLACRAGRFLPVWAAGSEGRACRRRPLGAHLLMRVGFHGAVLLPGLLLPRRHNCPN
jgi:hypothetical protein